jgi:predicted dehydrogenase
MIKIAIIGYGYWGPNLVRNFSRLGNVSVHTVVDIIEGNLFQIKKNYPTIHTTKSISEVIFNNSIDAIVIATPVHTHFEIARKALEAGKHVLVEKPITLNSSEAKILIDLSIKFNKILMVDHTFLYTGAVKKMKELLAKGELGKFQYFDSTRINLGLFQSDINVLWDLAPHDLSILQYLIDEIPLSVNATGISHTNNGLENIAYLTVNYQSGLIAHFNCSWTSPVKIRMTLLGGDKKMVVYNDMEPTEKIKVYNAGYTYKSDEEKRRILVDYRVGDIYVPKLDTKEALSGMAEDFIDSIINNSKPESDYTIGLNVVKILEASQLSIKNNGKEIALNL